jgi:hypothetical protein
MVGGDQHFDLLVCELYDTVGGSEQVVETISGLREHGFTFGAVVSRGFESWLAPVSAPTLDGLRSWERRLLGWRGRDDPARERSVLLGDPARVARMRLGAPRLWQSADFESPDQVTHSTADELWFPFDGEDADRFAGVCVHNRFLFRNGALDTGTSVNNWGVAYLPLPLPAEAVRAAGGVSVRTALPDPRRPSVCVLTAHAGGVTSPAVTLP